MPRQHDILWMVPCQTFWLTKMESWALKLIGTIMIPLKIYQWCFIILSGSYSSFAPRIIFCMSFHCYLDLGESDLEIDRDHSSPMDSLPMKFHHYRYKNSRVMLKKPFSMSLYKMYLRPSLSQNDLEINKSHPCPMGSHLWSFIIFGRRPLKSHNPRYKTFIDMLQKPVL